MMKILTLLMGVALACTPALAEPCDWSQISADSLLNGGFEDDGLIWWMHTTPISGWEYVSSGPFHREVATEDYFGHWITEGDYSLQLWNLASENMHDGDYASVSQTIDFTDIVAIQFDAYLADVPERDVWTGNSVALFLIDGVPYWTADSIGEHLDRTVDVSGLSGLHEIAFRLEMTDDFQWQSNWLYVDDVRAVVPEPTSITLYAIGAMVLLAGRTRKNRIAQQSPAHLHNDPRGRGSL